MNAKLQIRRRLSQEVLEMAGAYPVVTLTGPRQSGKTTLVRSLFKEKIYLSLENLDVRQKAKEAPRQFLEDLPNGAILDEIQRVPELLSYIQGIVDDKKVNGVFILTGSYQLALHSAISQSLAGRTAMLKLPPFSIAELKQANLPMTVDEWLLTGMYPRIYQNHLNPSKFYRDYVETYLERDVRQMVNVKDLNLFQKYMRLSASRVGQILNINNLSSELGVSNTTVGNWISILEASFIIFRFPPYFENFGKRAIKSPKLYFTDVGLCSIY